MRILFLTTVLPGAERGGGEVVSNALVRALRSVAGDVTVLGYRRPGDAGSPADGEVCAGTRPIETSEAGARAPVWMARALATRAPYSTTKYRSRGYARTLARALDGHADAVVIDHIQALALVTAVRRPLPPAVFVAHNAEAVLYDRLAAHAGSRLSRWVNAREARLIGASEREAAERARQVWALTAEDAGYFESLSPSADVRTLAPASAIAARAHEKPEAATCDIALIGNWTWGANARGLEWFAGEVLPRLPPDLSVEVAGAGAEWLRAAHPRVTVHGLVPDAHAFLARARALAVPATTGSGVQVKTLDAIASGAPVVATSSAVRGLADLPSSVVVEDAGAAFAGALARLAALGRPEPLRAESIAWSRARAERLETDVGAWIAELEPRIGAHGAQRT